MSKPATRITSSLLGVLFIECSASSNPFLYSQCCVLIAFWGSWWRWKLCQPWNFGTIFNHLFLHFLHPLNQWVIKTFDMCVWFIYKYIYSFLSIFYSGTQSSSIAVLERPLGSLALGKLSLNVCSMNEWMNEWLRSFPLFSNNHFLLSLNWSCNL